MSKPESQQTILPIELAVASALYHLIHAPEPDKERIRRAIEILRPYITEAPDA